MKTVTVTALRAFPYAGRTVACGEIVSVAPLEAAQLSRRGIVSLSLRATSRAMQAEAPPESPEDIADKPKARRNYRRRDVVAAGTE